jgi:putative Mg2+ transporter-C (MgtC) family protein
MLQDLLGSHASIIALNLAAAWLAGAAIGMERSVHGRPAGFRTHALVCLSSALLMVVFNFQEDWLGEIPVETLRSDPTRMAQGIMTGIGFLGAGVIFKDGMTVRGLTTAASIWTTAAIGILFGIGFLFPAILGTLVVLGTLSAFRWLEARVPSEIYANHLIRFPAGDTMPEADVRAIMERHGFSVANMNYRLEEGGHVFEYRMTLKTFDKRNLEQLASDLRTTAGVLEFRLSPSAD